MSNIYGFAQQQNVSRSADGGAVGLRATRDGSLISVPWVMALVLEGRVFSADGGKADGLLTIMTTYADTSKTIFVDVPDGTAMIPLMADFTFGATGAAIDYAKLFVSPTLNGVAGTETVITPINWRLDSPVATAATAAHTASSETDNVTGVEVTMLNFYCNQDLDATAIGPNFHWSIGQDGFAPVGVDGASFNLALLCTTSGTGCGSLAWAELPESAIT